MQIDTFLKNGCSKKICEDYILQTLDPVPAIILSDGCSSSKNTDVGARILVHLAKKYLDITKLLDHKIVQISLINEAKEIQSKLKLDKTCLDATLIIMILLDNVIHVCMFGDGIVIGINKENILECISVSYTNNAPFYLSYLLDDDRKNIYSQYENQKIEKHIFSNVDLNFEKKLTQYQTNFYNPSIFSFDANRFKTLLISSDGLESFITTTGHQPYLIDVVKQVTDFKNTNGEFIKRRMGSKKGVINTFFSENEMNHHDDISIGGFVMS